MKRRVEILPHARAKMTWMAKAGFEVSEEEVVRTVEEPDLVAEGRGGRKIAQRAISDRHVLRVVYEETAADIRVVTLYPGRRDRYEDEL